MLVPEDLLKALYATSVTGQQAYWDRLTPRIAEDWAAIPSDLSRALMGISIRGRLAFATACLETYVKVRFQECSLVTAVIAKLWQFVESHDLGRWDSEISEVAGDIMNSIDESGADFISRWGPGPDIPTEVTAVPLHLRILICNVIEIGRYELYAGISGVSLGTLWPTIIVAKQLLGNGLSIPNIDAFKRSSFDQGGGWGKPEPKAFFNNHVEMKE